MGTEPPPDDVPLEPERSKPSAARAIAEGVGAQAVTEAGCCLLRAAVGASVLDCFVATASLQPADPRTHPDLVALRALRDRVLACSAAGRAFTRAYYRWGRYPARAIEGRPMARFVVREGLVRPLARWVLARRAG